MDTEIWVLSRPSLHFPLKNELLIVYCMEYIGLRLYTSKQEKLFIFLPHFPLNSISMISMMNSIYLILFYNFLFRGLPSSAQEIQGVPPVLFIIEAQDVKMLGIWHVRDNPATLAMFGRLQDHTRLGGT